MLYLASAAVWLQRTQARKKNSKHWHVKWPCSLWICEDDCGGCVKPHSWSAGEPAVPVRHRQHSLHVCQKNFTRAREPHTQSLFHLLPFIKGVLQCFGVYLSSYQRLWDSALFVNNVTAGTLRNCVLPVTVHTHEYVLASQIQKPREGEKIMTMHHNTGRLVQGSWHCRHRRCCSRKTKFCFLHGRSLTTF